MSYIYHEWLRPSQKDWSWSGEWCIVTMSSGLVQWVGNEDICSGPVGHSFLCLGRDYQDVLRFGLLRGNRTEKELYKCMCMHSCVSFSVSVNKPMCLLAEGASMCAIHLCQYCQCLCPQMYARVCTCLSLIGLCVGAVKVDVFSIKGWDNWIAQNLIYSHFS